MNERTYRSVDWRGRSIKRPYPWERDMTVCIAAICTDLEDQRIVLCTDRRSGSILGSSEAGYKDVPLGRGWRCLTSGTESDIIALVRLYRERFANPANLQGATIDASVKEPLKKRKRDLADEYIQGRFAISYDEFLKIGKDRLPSDVFYDAVQKVSHIDLKADLIIAGFIGDTPEIYHTDGTGKSCPAANFSVVGEGEYLAAAVLLRRQQHEWNSLDVTLFNVYEAKKAAEAVGSVGKKTFISVLSKEGSRLTSLDLDVHLQAVYDKFSVSPKAADLSFDGDYYFNKAPHQD